MNGGASSVIAEGLLKGMFDVLDAMLSLSFDYAVTGMGDSDAGGVEDALLQYPLVMQARIASGGAVALLLPVEEASRFVSLVLGEEGAVKESLAPEDLETLREIADPCLGGGVTNLMEQFGRNVEQPEDVAVGVRAPEEADGLLSFLEAAPVRVDFTFSSAPMIDSSGVVLFAKSTEGLVPEDMVPAADGDDLAQQAQLSDDEMSDILSGFTPEEGDVPPAAAGRSPAPTNLDMVLDIRLTATARLGHVEMPVGEILSLGAGSIVEVGRLVDEPVELLVNDKLIARGDVVVVDEKFGLRITEIVSPQERIESMR